MDKMTDEDFRDTVREAEKGEVDSQFVLADAYYTGEGVERDYAKAAHWFAKAAEQVLPGRHRRGKERAGGRFLGRL